MVLDECFVVSLLLVSSGLCLVSSLCGFLFSLLSKKTKDKCQTRKVTVNKQLQQPEEQLIEHYLTNPNPC